MIQRKSTVGLAQTSRAKWLLAALLGVSQLTSTVAADQLPDVPWTHHGATHSEQRFVQLDQINAGNVERLGLEWFMSLPEARTLEATPLVVNGVLYFSTNDSIVYAVDARSGKLNWRYDPEVWKVAGKRYRQVFHVNRGVAYLRNKIFVGTFDGRLIALDAETGKQLWSTQTLKPGATGYITGAPRAFKNIVIIGNGGTENGQSRGYVTAYDADTGELAWRFFTVPGNPANGFENDAMAMAAETWTGEWWVHGGGATVWNAMTYDPDFNRVYIGTGNGSPWNHLVRSPEGGDNLFVCSIVALDADTGEYIWHYQTNPGETWDYTSTQDIVLADLRLDGKDIKAILHAPKNGFYYVLDRENGKLVSAEKLGTVTWAQSIDIESGRPVENPESRLTDREAFFYPGSAGLHNWQSMSYNPSTNVTYIPKLELPQYFSDKSIDRKKWLARPFFFNTSFDDLEYDTSVSIPMTGSLLAWDAESQSKVWEVTLPGIWNGGTMVTDGNLVFQGNASGEFAAYNAMTGDKLWSTDTGLGIVAAPISYRLDGKQYVAILSGWGGSLAGMFGLEVSKYGWQYGDQPRRLLVYALDGDSELPIHPKSNPVVPLDVVDLEIDEIAAASGRELFNSGCQSCHGYSVVAGGSAPDLRASQLSLSIDAFTAVLREGLLESRGMPKYDDLTDEEINVLFHYIRQRARTDLHRSH